MCVRLDSSKQWMPIFHVILDQHTNSLKDCLVLGHTMTEALVKNIEILDAPVEGFVAGLGPLLESLQVAAIKWVAGADLCLAPVPFVPNNSPARGDLALQAIWFSVYFEIILARRKWAIDPNKSILAYCDPKLVGQPGLVILLGIPTGAWLGPWFIDSAMSAVHRNDENIIVLVLLVEGPNNLVARKENLLEMVLLYVQL
jgi:hypothetical protein